jgi:aerobactin synthase
VTAPGMALGPLQKGRVVTGELWRRANRAILARAISELTYEEVLTARPLDAANRRWEVPLGEGLAYRFGAARRIWGQLSIDPETLVRAAPEEKPADDAVAFFVDARTVLDISAPTLSTYARELYNTLMADTRILAERQPLTAFDLARLPDLDLQRLLDGHPKAPANKGRIGWGLEAFQAYSPEFGSEFQLFWIAAARSHLRLSLDAGLDEAALLNAALNRSERARLEAARDAAGISADTHALVPVHPWQWQAMLAATYAGEIAAGRIVPLGQFGDRFAAQQSLRTLANVSRPEALHVKLPLTVLNTSAWRGVPGKYMDIGPALSRWLAGMAATDPALEPVRVLGEVAGAFYPHPQFERIPEAPYQHLEMLGAIWRESPLQGLPKGRRPMMMGALPQCDAGGRPVISALIELSGLGHEAWLERLFSTVFVPLYHFLCRYGVGFIAHGQNITVILEGDVPVGVAVKDFQGDLDLVDVDFVELATLDPAVRATLKKRPPAHLFQHLQTGHIASVLRFVSAALADFDGFDEAVFYRVLADCVVRYQSRHPELAERFRLFDLLQPKMPRIAINKVRFAIGYGDAGERPVPALGTELDNPLYLGLTIGRGKAA